MSLSGAAPDRTVYLDHNATTPLAPEALEAMLPYLREHFGNPSSRHAPGRTAARAVDRAREQTAALLGAAPEEIVFTASGSEANTLALRGTLARALRSGRDQLITQTTEHPSVLETCADLARRHGVRVVRLPVDSHGRVSPEDLGAVLSEATALVSVQLANGETGTLQPVTELAALARAHGVPFHTDASQAIGKTEVDVRALDVDLLTLAGHKFRAPKGIGALYVRSGRTLQPQILGGGQERARRAGTENVPAIVGLGAAAELAAAALPGESARLRALRDTLHAGLGAALPGRTRLNGHPEERLPNTLNVSIEGTIAAAVLDAAPRLAASTASACHAGHHQPSEVLTAMGLEPIRALAAYRLSLGADTTGADVEAAVRALAGEVSKATKRSSLV
jgi:cysteine desulfurase